MTPRVSPKIRWIACAGIILSGWALFEWSKTEPEVVRQKDAITLSSVAGKYPNHDLVKAPEVRMPNSLPESNSSPRTIPLQTRIDQSLKHGQFFEAYLLMQTCPPTQRPRQDQATQCNREIHEDKPFDLEMARVLAAATEAGDRRAYIPYAELFPLIMMLKAQADGSGQDESAAEPVHLEATAEYQLLYQRFSAAASAGEAEGTLAAARLLMQGAPGGLVRAFQLLNTVPQSSRTPQMEDELSTLRKYSAEELMTLVPRP